VISVFFAATVLLTVKDLRSDLYRS
jgi:hypothetical protein